MLYYRFGVGFLKVLSELFIRPATRSLLFMSEVSRHVGHSFQTKVALTPFEGFGGVADLLLPLGVVRFFADCGLLVCFAKVVCDLLLRVTAFFTSSNDDI
jgi:hypothetical protein